MGFPLPPGFAPPLAPPPPYGYPPPVPPGPYTAAYGATASGTTLQQTLISNVARGDAIVVAASSNSVASAPASCADSQGNAYQMVSSDTTRTPNVVFFVALGCNPMTASVDTITVTFGSSSTVKQFIARGYSGVAAFDAIDQVATPADAANTSAPSITSAALGYGTEWAVTALANGAGAGAPNQGAWTGGFQPVLTTGPGPYLTLADQIVTSPAALTAATTLPANGSWAMLLVTLAPVPMINPLSALAPPGLVPPLAQQPWGPPPPAMAPTALADPGVLPADGQVTASGTKNVTGSAVIAVTSLLAPAGSKGSSNGAAIRADGKAAPAGAKAAAGSGAVRADAPIRPAGGKGVTYGASIAATSAIKPLALHTAIGSAVFPATGVIAPAPVVPNLANTWTASYTAPSQPSGVPLPGPASLPVNVAGQNTAGNWLFCVAAWRQAPGYPAVTVQAGDGTNRWEPMGQPGGTSPALAGGTTASVRIAVWRAPAARKVKTVAVAPTGFVLSLAVAVIEVPGLLPWIAEAGTLTAFGPGVSSLPGLDPPASTVPVFWLTACARSLSAPTGTYPGAASLLVPLSGVPGEASPGQMVPGDPDIPQVTGSGGIWEPGPCAGTGDGLDDDGDLALLTAFQTATGSVTAQWSQDMASDMAAIVCGVVVSAPAPAQPNPAWAPGVFEVAPGAGAMTPADQITWVPVDGVLGVPVRQQDLAFTQGQQYTVGSLQAGDGAVTIDSRDLAATPPGLGPLKGIDSGIPWRYRATWPGGNGYPVNPAPHYVLTGFTRDLPTSRTPARRTVVKTGLTDSWAYCQPQIRSALRQEMLADNPTHLWPCGDASGVAYASNLAPGSAAALVQVQSKYGNAGATAGFGTAAALSAAQATVSPATGSNLPGGGGTVWGQSGLPASPSTGGYCLYCQDSAFPALNGAYGISVECWTAFTDPVLQQAATAWAIKGTKAPVLRLFAGTGGQLSLAAFDRNGTVTTTSLGAASYLGAGLFQTVVTWQQGTGWIAYVNGVPVASGGASVNLPPRFSWITAGGAADRQFTGNFFNGQTCFLGVFPLALPPSRVASHWQAGAFAFAQEADHSRMERLLTYAGYTSKRVIRRQPLPDQTASLADLGQSSAGTSAGGIPAPAGSGTVQAGQQMTALVASLTPAQLFVAPTGDIVWQPKGLQYGQPAVWTLNDTGTGIPYQGDVEFPWDPQRVLNDIQLTQADRQDVVTPQAFVPANPAYATPGATRGKYGQQTYQITAFLFNDLTTPLSSASPSNVLDLANWLSVTLASPHLRVGKLTVDAATYPAAWPLVLGVSPGDVALVGYNPITASASLSLLARVMRVERQISWGAGKGVATATLTLDYAPELSPIILDDPVAGQLDGTRTIAW